jgi:hypothetical protein
MDLSKVFCVYLVSFMLSGFVSTFAYRIASANQAILALCSIKWVFIFAFSYCAFVQNKGYRLLAIILILEFSSGLLSYFASFKGVFIVSTVAALGSPKLLQPRRLITLALIAIALTLSIVLWTAVKSDYRYFLNEGTGAQAITVSTGESLTYLRRLVADVDMTMLSKGFEDLVLRLSYVHYFAYTQQNVPSNLPYEDGALWAGALKHVLAPRLLFPDKASLDDSARASLYTGLEVSGVEQGTSIGIGYMAESYVDFGPIGMHFPVLLLGALCGLIYRGFIINAKHKILGCGIAATILMFGASTIETSNSKLLGGILSNGIVLLLFYLLFGARFMSWMHTGKWK